MPAVNWSIFEGLPGDATHNFEYLCRSLIRRHYNRFGSFRGLANQPGIEFHLNIQSDCSLGETGRWYGWQCKWYDLPSGRAIGSTRRQKIEDAIIKTEEILPDITDWVLWTRHTLTAGDQRWFYGISSKMRLHLWTKDEVEEHLSGPAEILRGTYFGELVLTPDELEKMHRTAIAPIRSRWIPEVHQVMHAEEQVRLSLGEVAAWDDLKTISLQLDKAGKDLIAFNEPVSGSISEGLESVLGGVKDCSSLLTEICSALSNGDYSTTSQLVDRGFAFNREWKVLLRKLRNANDRRALYLTNILALFSDARIVMREMAVFIQMSMVAVLASAGCGKTQLAAEITSPTKDRVAGVFLHGRNLNARQRLDDLAKTVVIQGRPVETFEALVAAVDAAGQRARRRLPVVIDGLNEAEDPRAWKANLESIKVTLENYPYVLLVCTLRTEFSEESLPGDVQSCNIARFQHTHEAVRAYFKHYLIELNDAALPVDLLEHPLTMRLFCEVTNPDRKKEVGVEAIPGSLTILFEKHLEQVSTRIAELSLPSCRYYVSDIRSALNRVGQTLWEENVRTVDFVQLRRLIDDSPRWDQSLVKALEEEGVFYRIPDNNSTMTIVSVSYDAFAGHIIADYILSQYGGPGFKVWLNEDAQLKLLFGDIGERHTLAGDILKALIGLLPMRMYREQLWRILEGQPRQIALYGAAWLSSDFLDRETVDSLSNLTKQGPGRYSQHLFSRLKITRAASSHPLDAVFFDTVLREMEMADRDIHWSEWVRRSSDSLKSDILYIEKGWRSNQTRDKDDKLRALWIKWILTTTDHGLRDHATRALYWFGISAPDELFQMTLDSFSVNDPYVPERMLAASYGVAMSIWADKSVADFKDILSNFVNSLIESLFMPGAPFATRHIFIKEFALGLIELAQKRFPTSIPVENLEFIQPPFDHLPDGFPDVATIDDSVSKAAESAIPMDFVDDTLCNIIPDRVKYDYTDPTYKAVRKQIDCRIVELGYSEDLFEQIDKEIRNDSWRYRQREGYKVDRYGKKYSQIAYYEMYGLRFDRNELSDWRAGERTPDIDIDPTFPDPPCTWIPELPELYAKPFTDVREWIEFGPTPNYTHLLHPKNVDGVEGPWVLLEGYIEQYSEVDARRTFTFLRGVLPKSHHADDLLKKFNEVRYPGNMSIPEPFQNHYCFAGEIPWSAQYIADLQNSKGSATADVRKAFSFPWAGVRVEVPVCVYCWESYHSMLNQAGNVTVLAPSLCDSLNIKSIRGRWDFYDEENNQATLCRVFKKDEAVYRSTLFYIREDLLDRYLDLTNQSLVWMLWGERGFHYKYSQDIMEDHYHLLSAHKHIHRFGLKYGDE
ncbi:hypothetical protein D0S45_03495 [Marinifilum sp. JC120]|nr:hypothetical protein D0S45_03495 [Marinifilum sp. JC120]